MAASPGQYDYPNAGTRVVGSEANHRGEDFRGYAEDIAERASQRAHELGDSAAHMIDDIAQAARERPYTTMAIAAGLAFAIGALWKVSRREPVSRLQSLLAQMPELPDRNSILPRRWR